MRIFKVLLVSVLVIAASFICKSQTVQITIRGIETHKGKIQIGIFTNQEQFKTEKPVIEKSFSKTGLVGGVLNLEIELPPGQYGIAVLDDVNSDKDMNYNFFGIPLEGFGFSNFYLSGMSKPKYEDFRFEVKKGITKIEVKMRYIL